MLLILLYFCHAALGADIYDAGYLNITNVDISTVVIAQMSELYSNRDEMECKKVTRLLILH